MSKASVLLSRSSPPWMLAGVSPSALLKALLSSEFRRSTTPWTVGNLKFGVNSKLSRKTPCLILALATLVSASRLAAASVATESAGREASVPFGFKPTVNL